MEELQITQNLTDCYTGVVTASTSTAVLQRSFLGYVGVNGMENVITPTLLRARAFGRIGNYSVDGAVYAHPLVVPGINVAGEVVTGVIVATQNNYVRFPGGSCSRLAEMFRLLTIWGFGLCV